MIAHQLGQTSTAQAFFNSICSQAIAKGLTLPTISSTSTSTTAKAA
jgi:hypothetical protein